MMLTSFVPAQTLMDAKPDFLFGSYASAFQAGKTLNYSDYLGFQCSLQIWHAGSKTYRFFCREDLHAAGIQTYLQVAACENVTLRSTQISEDIVKREIWDIANIFGAQANAMKLIENIDQHFKMARKIVMEAQAENVNMRMKVLWLDMFKGGDNDPFIGACCGSPNLLIEKAGAVNALPELGRADRASWANAGLDEIAKADPDVIVLNDANWDMADVKLFHLCNTSKTRSLRAVQNRDFVAVAFSGSTLGAKNGAVAFNLAEAMVALVTGRTLNSEEFSVLTITADGNLARSARSSSGVRTYITLPTIDLKSVTKLDADQGKKINLDEFCPGKNKVRVEPPPKPEAPFRVKMALSLPYAKDAFNTGLQRVAKQVRVFAKSKRSKLLGPTYGLAFGYKERASQQEHHTGSPHVIKPHAQPSAFHLQAISVAAGVRAEVRYSDVSISKIESQRRQAANVRLDVTVSTVTAKAAEDIRSSLTDDGINAEFRKAGLLRAQMLEGPSVVRSESWFGKNAERLSGGAIAGIVIGSTFGALLLIGVPLFLLGKRQGYTKLQQVALR
jgi:hypothetical protein